MLRIILATLTGCLVAGALILTAIGPDWRRLLANPPTDTDILFWGQAQRDAGFRMLDEIPIVAPKARVKAGDRVRALPQGAPLEPGIDMDAYFEAQRLAGMVILHKGEIVYERYGLDFSAGGRWTSFSVAKSFTSSLAGAAIRDGHIKSLDDKVSTYLPALSESPYDDVTIAQLLTMTSGVDWSEDYDDPQSDVARFAQHKPDAGLASIVSYMRGLERAHPPGEKWLYSTGETNLIGVLVSAATGKPLSDYLSEKIWRPFGMEQGATWLVGPDGEELSGCCIQATIRDFAPLWAFHA